MNPLSFISTTSSSAVGRAEYLSAPRPSRTDDRASGGRAVAREADQLELSDRFRTTFDDLATESSSEPIRQDLVNRIRSEIASGTYETPEKLVIAAHLAARELDVTG